MSITRSLEETDLDRSVGNRAFIRIVGFLFVLQMINYLDRINLSFAALSMNRDLGLSATAFGLVGTMFYAGYILFEIPSNMVLVRVGARRWIARIVFTWGLATMLTVFAAGPVSLGALRSLVGIAEAGFLPGVMLYLTYWFPSRRRAKATSTFLLAQQAAAVVGSIGSVLVLQNFDRAFGLAGWQWLFIVTGLPAVVAGVAVWFFLPDTPATARWLSPAERDSLERSLTAERPRSLTRDGADRKALLSAPFIMICAAYFCVVTDVNTLAIWQPLIIRSILGDASSLLTIGVLSAIPSLTTLTLMPVWAASSDRRQERILHYVLPAALGIIGWMTFLLSAAQTLRLAGIVISTVGGFTGVAILWTMPASVLPLASRPIGIGIVATVGIAGSLTSPVIIGLLKDLTGDFNAGIWYATFALALSIVMILLIPGGALEKQDRAGARA